MQNKRHLYVQDALALNGLEAGRSCFDDCQHQKALRPLADGSRSAKDSTRSQCQFGCENDTSDGSSEICIIRWSSDRWAGLRSIFHFQHGKKQLNWKFTNTSISELLPTTNSHMQDLSARLEQFDSWNNLNNLTLCKILENKLAICKTTQDLFVWALPHQCNPVQLGIAYVMMCFRKPTHWHKNSRINRSIACYPSRKVELELRHKMESAMKSLTSKTVYSFYDFGAASKVTV